MHYRKTRKPGFTLIELLVVIAIIAILAAILFPVFAQARSKARQAAGTSNAKQVALAINMYVQDYDERWPRAGWECQTNADDPSIPPGAENACGATSWQNVTAPYHKNGGIFVSPGDASQPDFTWGPDMHMTDGNESLLINDLLSHDMPTTAAGYCDVTNQVHYSTGLSLASVNSPADCVLLSEGHCGWAKLKDSSSAQAKGPDWTGSTDPHNKWHMEQTMSGYQTWLMAGTNYVPWGVRILGAPFYNGGGIVAFTDGHVKYVKMTDSNGQPILCSTLKFAKHVDPLQRGAEADGCNNPNNPLGGNGNWQ